MTLKVRNLSSGALIASSPITNPKGMYILLAFSVPFLMIGMWIMGGYFDWFPLDRSKVNVSMEIFLVAGSVFELIGLSIFISALNGLFNYHNKAKLRFRYPNEPWYWDFKWNRKGHNHSLFKRITHHLFGLACFIGLFTPGIYIAFYKKGMPIFFKFILVGMGLFFFTIITHKILKNLKFRTVECEYLNFPFKLGSDLRLKIKGLPKASDIKKLDIYLKCFEFKMQKQRSGNKTSYKQVSKELFKQRVEVDKNEIVNGILDISTKITDKKELSTDFVKNDFICWELNVKADIPGIDYHYGFIIPIYK